MRQIVLPIKDDEVLKQVQDTLLNNFKSGQRNYTIFQVGKATLLRVSDVLRLKQADVFDDYGAIKQHAFIKVYYESDSRETNTVDHLTKFPKEGE